MRRKKWPGDAAGWLSAVLAGAGAVVLVSWAGGGDTPPAWMPDTTARAQARPAAAPAYTNDDLERVRPLRGETGVESQPAVVRGEGACRVDGGATPPRRGRARGRSRPDACATEADPEDAGPRGAPHDEAYWRREARRVRDKLRVWAQQIEDLELKLAERHRKPGVRPGDTQIAGWQRRIEALRHRMRELEGDLEDRARRERALPGWLR